MPRSMTPAVPPESCLNDSFVLASGTLKSSPTAFYSDEAELLKGGTSPLRPTVFPVYASQLLFAVISSASRATLGTGCWLGFARQGLPAVEQGTLQEAPSFAWRTNVELTGCGVVSAILV